MGEAIPGIHHITAICGAPQTNIDFYAGALRQRLVKQTVNFDDPGTYHLYYGDAAGTPGTILTFFPFAGAAPGKAGPGMASAFSYAIPGGADELAALEADLAEAGVQVEGPLERFGDTVIAFADPDGLRVELVAEAGAAPLGAGGFHGITLWLETFDKTHHLLTDIFGYDTVDEAAHEGTVRRRLKAPGGAAGAVIDLVRRDGAPAGRPGTGTIHHVAFRAENDAVQDEWRQRLLSAGFEVTPVIDRQYFNAIYFREPGGILFEIATDPPGFAVDEPAETLGRTLKLPPQYEPHRAEIAAVLPPITVPEPAGG